jgi:RHS repeat-associated protein
MTTYSYNWANEMVLVVPPSGQPTTVTWDACGALAVTNAGGMRTTYTWDWEERLKSMTSADGSVERYVYSGGGQRRQKETSESTVNFVWDDGNLLQEWNAAPTLVAHYTDWPEIWGGLVSQRRGATSSFYRFDLTKSTRALMSSSGGDTDSYIYHAFGEEEATGISTNPFRYVGQLGYYRDSASKLYVRARNLAVDAGRWMSRDPLGLAALDRNLYAYVVNNPLRFADPTGELVPSEELFRGAAVVGGAAAAGGTTWAEAQALCTVAAAVGLGTVVVGAVVVGGGYALYYYYNPFREKPPKRDPRDTCKPEICQEVTSRHRTSKGLDEDRGGVAVCKDGKRCVCLLGIKNVYDPNNCDWLDSCVFLHEKMHFPDDKCEEGEYKVLRIEDDAKRKARERDLRKWTLNCFEGNLKNATLACQRDMKRLIKWYKETQF